MQQSFATRCLQILRNKSEYVVLFVQTYRTSIELEIARDHFRAETRLEIEACRFVFTHYAQTMFPFDGAAQQRFVEDVISDREWSLLEIFRFETWYFRTYVAAWYTRFVWRRYQSARWRDFFQVLGSF